MLGILNLDLGLISSSKNIVSEKPSDEQTWKLSAIETFSVTIQALSGYKKC